MLAAKVLTVSDGVVAGTRDDRSGDALVGHLDEHDFDVVDRQVVADGIESVARTLRAMTDGFAGLVVTTGGTGFGPRDLTPEGTRAVLEREAPGLAEAMRLVNPLGRLSRQRAGTMGGGPRPQPARVDDRLDRVPRCGARRRAARPRTAPRRAAPLIRPSGVPVQRRRPGRYPPVASSR